VADTEFVGLIPARDGSKGVPKKNWRPFLDGTLVSRSIDAARTSERLAHIFVSTDRLGAEGLVSSWGAELVPRSRFASTDSATAADVVRDFLDQRGAELDDASFVVYLQPTAPLRTGSHIREAIDLCVGSNADACISVVHMPSNALKCVTLSDDGLIKPIISSAVTSANRQSLPEVFRPNGAIYMFRISTFRRAGGFPITGAVPYFMSDADSIDIDTSDDWDLAIKEASRNA